MKKYILPAFTAFLFLSAISINAQEKNSANNFGFGWDVSNSGNNYGVGVSIVSPWFIQNHVSVKLHGGYGILSAGEFDPMPYAGLVIMGGGIAFGGFGRFYGFINPVLNFAPGGSDNILFSLDGGFGFEFFLDEKKHSGYYLEAGGGGGQNGTIKNFNGFFMRVGFNYRL